MLALVIWLSVVALLTACFSLAAAFRAITRAETLEHRIQSDANGTVHRAPNGRFTSAKGKG